MSVKFPTWTAGETEELLDKLGSDDVGRQLIAVKGKINVDFSGDGASVLVSNDSPSLQRCLSEGRAIDFPERSNGFCSDRFQANPKIEVSRACSLILEKAGNMERVPGRRAAAFDLECGAVHGRVLEELPQPFAFALPGVLFSSVEYMIESHVNFLCNGEESIFYLKGDARSSTGYVVRVSEKGTDQWFVHATRLDVTGSLKTGQRVFAQMHPSHSA